MPAKGQFNDVIPRIESRLLPPNASGCRIWTGEKLDTGSGIIYGAIWYEGKRVKLHRVVFFLEHGYWPKVTRHTCDVPLCGAKEHLIDGTQADNHRDMRERGRAVNPPVMCGEDNPAAKLTWPLVRKIRAEYVPRKVSQRFLSRKYNVSQPLVGLIVRNEIWRED